MGERKGVNKYYPPDWTPEQGSINKYHGTHALRERARKLHEGILIIRFEMPYNIWCNGCGNHIGMGVRYNAQKRKVGNYYSTVVYKFRMKCHLCDQHFEIQTDPQNCDYKILSGARRKEERWDPESTENVQATDHDVKKKLVADAMYKLEHSIIDKQAAKKKAPTLDRLEEIRSDWSDDFAVNQLLRKKFRNEKKDISDKKNVDDRLKDKSSLPNDFDLVHENPDDIELAKRIRYGQGNERPDLLRLRRKREIKQSSILKVGNSSSDKLEFAKHLLGIAQRQKHKPFSGEAPSLGSFSSNATLDGVVRTKLTNDNAKKRSHGTDSETATNGSDSLAPDSKQRLEKAPETVKIQVTDQAKSLQRTISKSATRTECYVTPEQGITTCSLVPSYATSSESDASDT